MASPRISIGSLFLFCVAASAQTLVFSPANFTFSIPFNTSATQTINVKNTGASLATITTNQLINVWPSGAFTLSSNTCGATVASGTSCNLSVTMASSASLGNAFSATLQVVNNGTTTNIPVTGSTYSNNSISFSFNIPAGLQDTRTSAAVFNSNGALVKTLWGNVSYPPGNYSQTWDGSMDGSGAATIGGSYSIRLLMNNVTYTYDGHFESTSDEWYYQLDSNDRCGWQGGLPKVAFAGNVGWKACGYAEGALNIQLFNSSTPNSPYPAGPFFGNQYIGASDIATDSQWVYLMIGPGYSSTNGVYVTALDANSGNVVLFTNGTYNAFGATWPTQQVNYIDYYAYTATNMSSGIAVQRNTSTCVYPSCGNILAVSHSGLNAINLFDKKSGVSLGTFSGITAPSQLAFTSEGLWVVAGGGLYLVTGLPSSPSITQPISGFANVVAVGANTLANNLFVLDGGTHQQMYEYAPSTHTLMRTYGTIGGYNDCNPTITKDRLMLDDTATTGTTKVAQYTWVAADDNDEVWISDGALRPGNFTGQQSPASRTMHISASNQYVNRILFDRPVYNVGVSETMPTRVLVRMVEYSMNYSATNVPGDPDPALGGSGAWEPIRNWAVCAMGAHGSSSPPWNAVRPPSHYGAPERLSNGNVYVIFGVAQTSTTSYYMFQLPDNGTSPMRYTGNTWPNGGQRAMLRDGSFGIWTTVGSTVSYTNTGPPTFDANANPVWGPYTTVVSLTTNATNSLISPGSGYNGGGGQVMPTTNGFYPTFSGNPFNSNTSTYYPHLAAAKAGFTSYAWQTMPEKCLNVPDYLGSFPCGVGYGGHNAIQPTRTTGQNVFVYYDGQYAGWGAQAYHFWEDGLMVGQFGMNQALPKGTTQLGTGTSQATGYPTRPGNAGNIGTFAVTSINSGADIYFYLADESFAPFHRYHISNLSSVHEYAGTGIFQPNGQVVLTQIF